MTEPQPYILGYYSPGYPVRELSLVAESDATADGTPGPRRLVGKVGRTPTERVANRAAPKIDGSPYVSPGSPHASLTPGLHAADDMTSLSVSDERELEWASDTDSTASDLSGPGRIYDNFIGSLARPLELAVNGAPRPPRPALPSPPTMSQASFVTDSDATDDQNTGAGHLVGKVISWGGPYIERCATWVAVKTGGGPYAVIEDLLAIVERHVCAGWDRPYDLCGIWSTPLPKGTRARSEALFRRLNHIATCNFCAETWNSDDNPAVSAKRYISRLLKLCSSANATISRTALTAVTDIGASSHFLWRMLLELRAETVMRDHMQQAYGSFGDHSLLARSRTALFCVSESGLMALVPQLAGIYARSLGPEAVHSVSYDFSMYLRNTDTRYLALCAMLRYSPVIGLALELASPVEDLIVRVIDLLLDSPNCAERAMAMNYVAHVVMSPHPRSISWSYVDLQNEMITVTRTLHRLGEDHIRTIYLIPHVKRKHCSVREALCHVEKVHRNHESFACDIWVSCPLRGTWRLVDHLFEDPPHVIRSQPPRFVRIA